MSRARHCIACWSRQNGNRQFITSSLVGEQWGSFEKDLYPPTYINITNVGCKQGGQSWSKSVLRTFFSLWIKWTVCVRVWRFGHYLWNNLCQRSQLIKTLPSLFAQWKSTTYQTFNVVAKNRPWEKLRQRIRTDSIFSLVPLILQKFYLVFYNITIMLNCE